MRAPERERASVVYVWVCARVRLLAWVPEITRRSVHAQALAFTLQMSKNTGACRIVSLAHSRMACLVTKVSDQKLDMGVRASVQSRTHVEHHMRGCLRNLGATESA